MRRRLDFDTGTGGAFASSSSPGGGAAKRAWTQAAESGGGGSGRSERRAEGSRRHRWPEGDRGGPRVRVIDPEWQQSGTNRTTTPGRVSQIRAQIQSSSRKVPG